MSSQEMPKYLGGGRWEGISDQVGFAVAEDEDFDLSRSAVLVRVKISQVGVTANSKRMSRDAAVTYEADKNSVKGYVQKIKWRDLSELTKIYNESRTLLNSKTLYWSEDFRMCPVQNYTDLTKEIRTLENRFHDEVTKLVRRHPELEADYKQRVGKLAEEVKFPTVEQMQAAFSFKFEEALIPSTDIRLHSVSEEMRKKISDRVREQVQAQMLGAQKDLISRFADAVEKISKGTRNGGKLHKSAVEALQATIEIAPSLNITNDPAIAEIIARAKKELGDIDPDEIRQSDSVKEQIATSAGSILDDLKILGKK